MELALVLVNGELLRIEYIQHCLYIRLVLRRCLREDENIIQITDYELVEKRSDRIIDDRLEGYRRVSQPKGHSEILKVPVVYTKRRLPLVTFLDTDIGLSLIHI